MSAPRFVTLATGLAAYGSASAEDFPKRVITIVVPYEAGGGVDRVARLLADHLQHTLKTSVIVENRAGANGNIGSDYVARADPDGYTLLYAPPGPLVINKLLYPKLNYDYDAFVPISLVVMSSNALVVHPKVEAKTVPELIAYPEGKSGSPQLRFVRCGRHSPPDGRTVEDGDRHLVRACAVSRHEFADHEPARRQHRLAFSEISNVLEHIRAGQLRVLGLAGEKRSFTLQTDRPWRKHSRDSIRAPGQAS